MQLRPLTLNGNLILQIKTFTNSVFVVFPNFFIGGSIQALCVLRAVQCVLYAQTVRKQTRVRFLNSSAEWGSFTIPITMCTVIFNFILIDFWLSRNNKLPEINLLSLLVIILVGS